MFGQIATTRPMDATQHFVTESEHIAIAARPAMLAIAGGLIAIAWFAEIG
jgi:hypothetical protein